MKFVVDRLFECIEEQLGEKNVPLWSYKVEQVREHLRYIEDRKRDLELEIDDMKEYMYCRSIE